ncbi:hypothetical protein VNI00_012443 [Paramarasmius palmivorus]|uniref:Uncharacterized protein n=1 Tax=Paramarasmius palmivorus TaxID=297713 RepID=A0AAW0C4P6_9AGAR
MEASRKSAKSTTTLSSRRGSHYSGPHQKLSQAGPQQGQLRKVRASAYAPIFRALGVPLSDIEVFVPAEVEYEDRPAVITSAPKQGNQGDYQIYLLASFSGPRGNRVHPCLAPYLMELALADGTGGYLHTTPEWDVKSPQPIMRPKERIGSPFYSRKQKKPIHIDAAELRKLKKFSIQVQRDLVTLFPTKEDMARVIEEIESVRASPDEKMQEKEGKESFTS